MMLLPGEVVMSYSAAVIYTAACPGCGKDAKWRDIIAVISGGEAGRTAVMHEVKCERKRCPSNSRPEVVGAA